MQKATYYKKLLQEEFSRRSEKNPRYSLRSFAKTLKVDPSSLSKVMSCRMVPSWKMAQSILSVLALPPESQNLFLSSLADSHRLRNAERLSPNIRNFSARTHEKVRELSADTFRVIADWYHYAILELTYTKGFKSDPKWIAAQLGISVMEAKVAIDRLLELELLEEKKGVLEKTDASLTTADKSITTPALRRRQKQVLEKAVESLESDPVELRDTTALCMAIDPKKIPEAKKRIQDFKKSLCEFLESGDREQVYELSISLFPTQKRGLK